MPPYVIFMKSRSHVAWAGYLGRRYDPFIGNQAVGLPVVSGRYPRGVSLRILNKEDIESGRKTRAQVKEENRTGARTHLGLRS